MNRKQLCADFLEACARGIPDRYFNEYLSNDFKHHNVFFKGDAQSLLDAIKENASSYPSITVDIQRIIEEGDLVAVHSHIKAFPEHLGSSTMHIFHFKNDKIHELWDFGQEVPENSINENGLF